MLLVNSVLMDVLAAATYYHDKVFIFIYISATLDIELVSLHSLYNVNGTYAQADPRS